MSLLSRPSVVFAIVFGCFAILVPRVFLPLFRSKPSTSPHNFEDRFRRPPPPVMSRGDHGDTVEHIHGTPPHMRGAHPHMRMHHPGASNRPPPSSEHTSSKSIVTLALPMYTVGIGVFFIYTCCKYWSKKTSDDDKTIYHHSNNNLRLNKEKYKFDTLDKDSEGEQENKDFYAGLDPDYIEYLKIKKQKALDAEKVMSDEQKHMHYALEEMKKSLSFISSKLTTKESRGNLDNNEIDQLQERLASTEAQMCKILTALDTASDKVNQMTKNVIESPTVETKEELDSISKSSSEDESLSSSDEEDNSNQIDDDDNYQRSRSHSLSSNNSSNEEDQSAPIDEQNYLIERKRQ